MKEQAIKTIEKYHMLQKGDAVIVGVSGGADSMALLYLLVSVQAKYNLQIIAVHIHHGLRGEQADMDEALVKECCKTLNLPFIAKRLNIKEEAEKNGLGLEEMGRLFRYEIFSQIAGAYLNSKIAVAHHMNDQAETVLMHLCRGTGIQGLSGIPPVRGNIIRPLLFCSRHMIEQYCAENNIAFRTDNTNLLDVYTRNKVRLHLLPWLEEQLNEKAVQNIASAAEFLREDSVYLDKLANRAFQQAVYKKVNQCIYLKKEVLLQLDLPILKRVLKKAILAIGETWKDFTQVHVEALIGLLTKQSGKAVYLPGGCKAEIEYQCLKLFKNVQRVSSFSYSLLINEAVYVAECGLYFKISFYQEKSYQKDKNICTKAFNYDKINGDVLTVRTRLPGDRLFLKGISGGKKLKNYFIDEKIPREKRGGIPLICIGNTVLWAVGLRVSECFLAEESTEHTLFISFWEDLEDEGKRGNINIKISD